MGASSSSSIQPSPKLSLVEIRLATSNFSEARVIGSGSFGTVYKGFIDDGRTTVAVKRRDERSRQGRREFHKEIETLTQIRHGNIVSLIGYCDDEGEMILVYEYVDNHTLKYHLSRPGGCSLTCHQRLSILIGAALGLHHLHDGNSGSSIIHRDMKSSNILLDGKFEAKVSDFGLARLVDFDKSHVSTAVKGSHGYVDPRYILSGGKLTRNSDTYSFGMVVLEALTGRLALDKIDGELLCDWAFNREARQIVDRNMSGNISEASLDIWYKVAKRCLRERPKLSKVLVELRSALHNLQDPKHYPYGGGLSGSTQEDTSELEQIIDVPVYPIATLEDMTEGFGVNCWIACGYSNGGSSVWRGVIRRTAQAVAIKLYTTKLPNQAFLAQVSTLSRLDHEKVVKLLGYCVDGDKQFIVSEFASKGSLHDILHGQDRDESYLEAGEPLSWNKRVNIAIDVAQGLCYIHDRELIHRNIKSSNVLLFEDGTAKITDLHLSSPCSCNGPNHQITCIRYYLPEFERDGDGREGDVHSFGIVLLELLTGEKPVDLLPVGMNLGTWATEQLRKHRVSVIVDAALGEHYPKVAVEKMAAVAALCLADEASARPNMDVVLRALKVASWETRNYYQKLQQHASKQRAGDEAAGLA